jgi:hypothetical protein
MTGGRHECDIRGRVFADAEELSAHEGRHQTALSEFEGDGR